MIVKMAVKETPALPGNKLKQHYFKVQTDFMYCYLFPLTCVHHYLHLHLHVFMSLCHAIVRYKSILFCINLVLTRLNNS